VSRRDLVADEDLEDIRIALVMSGGVSLAVWIGGVTRELHALIEAEPGDRGVYGDLLDITKSTVRADVITGTSAGGLNGAFLALASVYGTSMEPLADLWIDKGGFERLLRSPMSSDPPSLLRGDDYFLPELREAFAKLWPPSQTPTPRLPADRPIHLAMTTTLMRGDTRTFEDDFGSSIIEVEHRGTFTFRRDHRTRLDATEGPWADPFAKEGVIESLALASRSTASFPFAFEPTKVNVGTTGDRLHPDMSEIADFARSTWALDGGVLVNRPVELALRAVFDKPAHRQVRRTLLFVDPDPHGPNGADDDDVGLVDGSAPSLRQVMLDSLVTLPRAQSLAQTFEELRCHNERVDAQRALRLDLADLHVVDDPCALARQLWPSYRRERMRRAVRNVLDIGRTTGAFRRPSPPAAPQWWSPTELETAFDAVFETAGLPFVPDADALDEPGSEGWGLAFFERLGYLALDLLRRAMWVAPIVDEQLLENESLRSQVRHLRRRLHKESFGIPAIRSEDERFWASALAALPDLPSTAPKRQERLKNWLTEELKLWPLPRPARSGTREKDVAHARDLRRSVEQATGRFADLLQDAMPVLRQIEPAAPFAGFGRSSAEVEELNQLLGLLELPKSDTRARRTVLDRLHCIEVVHFMFACDVVLEQPITLMRVDGSTPNSFNGPSAIAAKLTGTRTGHFAAFYKASWRANDWL